MHKKLMQTIFFLFTTHTIPTIMGYGPNDKVVPTKLKYKLWDNLKENNIEYIPESSNKLLTFIKTKPLLFSIIVIATCAVIIVAITVPLVLMRKKKSDEIASNNNENWWNWF